MASGVGTHTHTYTNFADKSNFKKPGIIRKYRLISTNFKTLTIASFDYVCHVALGPVSGLNTSSDDPVTSSEFTLTWMDIGMTSSNFRHYIVFYLPVRGPYGPIMASNRRKRQSVQPEGFIMNFTGTTGTLTNLNGSVTYRIQVAAVTTFDSDEVIGDRSAAILLTTLEGRKQILLLLIVYFNEISP